MENKKFYLITFVENLDDNETSVTHEGIVSGDLHKAQETLRKKFYDRLVYWLEEWAIGDEESVEDYFTINQNPYEYNATSETDHIQAYIEEVNLI